MENSFSPIPVLDPSGFRGKAIWRIRLLCDLQLASIVRDVQAALGDAKLGKVIDVGCGDMPFRHLVQSRSKELDYVGYDVAEATGFGFGDRKAVRFDGRHLPIDSESVDTAICTEVLEHHPDPQALITEIHRVLRPGGILILTIPWSARVHFSPHDYGRYTPHHLERIFSDFSDFRITPRGTDLASICSKIIVVFLRCCRGSTRLSPRALLGVLLLAPWIPGAIALGQLGVHNRLGSTDDPLGYTIVAKR